MTRLSAEQLCGRNPHGQTHCWHWRGGPPTMRTEVQADCCWCGEVRAFSYEKVLFGDVPASPSTGAAHGTARDWLNEPTTYTLGRLSAKTAAREHAQKVAAALRRESDGM